MPRYRRFLTTDVLTEARARMRHVLDAFDGVTVAFSGGKDSMACLYLVREALADLGRDEPVRAVFRDMEFVPGGVLRAVERMAAEPWVDLHWWCLPMHSAVNILGKKRDLTVWDDARPSYRTRPEGAWTGRPGHLYGPGEWDEDIAALAPGLMGIVTGVRTAESLLRYRSAVNKLHEPYITASPAANARMIRPLYDWQENDVFRYLHEQGAVWADTYDALLWAGEGTMRTASTIAPEQMKKLRALREADPDAYAALLEAVPEAAVADRYYADYDRHSEEGDMLTVADVKAWCLEFYADSPEALRRALARVEFAERLIPANPEGFPPWHIYREVKRDGHGKGLLPLPTTHARYGKG